MEITGQVSRTSLPGVSGRQGRAHSRTNMPRLNSRTAASSSDAAPSSTTSSFSAGQGKAGTASTAKPQVSTEEKALASSETIKESQGMAKLFLQTELGNIFQTGVRQHHFFLSVMYLLLATAGKLNWMIPCS